MKTNAFLFDLDGTLLDTSHEITDSVNQLLQEEGCPPLTIEKIRPVISEGIQGLLKLAFQMEKSHPSYENFKQRLIEFHLNSLGQNTPLFPGMEQVLDKLEKLGMAWGIVTNKPKFLTDPLLKTLELDSRTSCVVSGDTLSVAKPHPEPMLHACKLLNCSPHECIYIGDAQRDIQAGKNSGIKTVLAMYGYIGEPNEALKWEPDYVIYHPTELLNFIQ